MEISSSSTENVQEAEGEGSDIGDSILANTILVPNDFEDDKEKTTDIPNLKNLAASRMEIIRQSMEKQNLDLTTINHLQHKHRKETINNYNRNWERWANWCSQQSPTINYLEYAPRNVLKYLSTPQNQVSVNTILSKIFSQLTKNSECRFQQERK
ncbi:hypothetical protein G6F38_013829 [Rhizopus arrhizus]|nr:hypothetical protein G6F38_013829 [Rhizopus arrhizus]